MGDDDDVFLTQDAENVPFIEKGLKCREKSWRGTWERNRGCLVALALFISLLANALLFFRNTRSEVQFCHDLEPQSYGKSLDIPTIYKANHWNTQYSSTNQTLTQDLWDRILPSHGFVAIDRITAAANNYPESMYLPGDSSKGVYLLGAYHQIHCLKILQRTMHEALTGSSFTWQPGEHIEHCFGYLLQVTMCNADTTHLYTFGHDTAGDAQIHQCKDWDAIRRYATENTACYRDTVEDVLLREHFGYCDAGDDGLEEPRRVERVVVNG